MPHHDRLFGFQRSPYIARIDTYGKSVSFSKKESVKVFTSLGNEYSTDFILNLSKALDINIIQLENFLEITLSNSNPILHPIRLYSIFNNINSFDVTYDYDNLQITESISGLNLTTMSTYVVDFSNSITLSSKILFESG